MILVFTVYGVFRVITKKVRKLFKKSLPVKTGEL